MTNAETTTTTERSTIKATRGVDVMLSELRTSYEHSADTAEHSTDPSTLAYVAALAAAIEAVEAAKAGIVATIVEAMR